MNTGNLLDLFSQELFVSIVLLVLLIVYGFYALVLSIQIRTYNKIITQTGFAAIFSFLSYLNVGIAIILILITLMTL